MKNEQLDFKNKTHFSLVLIYVSLINIQLLFILLLVLNFIVIDEFKKHLMHFSIIFLFYITAINILLFFTLILLNYLSQSFLVNKFTVYFLLS